MIMQAHKKTGKYQHYIQKKFLKNFSIKNEDKKYKLWVFRFDGKIFETTTEIAAENEFYSPAENYNEITLDRYITDYELKNTNKKLDFLLSEKCNKPIESNICASILLFYCFRSKFFRKYMHGMFSFKEKDIKNYLFKRHKEKIVDKIMEKTSLPEDEYIIFRNTMQYLVDSSSSFSEQFDILFNEFYIKHIVKDGYDNISIAINNDLLSLLEDNDDILMPKLHKALEKFKWHVEDVEFELILPDCIAVCVDKNGNFTPILGEINEETQHILMPISSKRILIGNRNENYYVDREVNSHFAKNSWDFFIANKFCLKLELLRSLIRTDAILNIEHITKTLVSNA